MHATPDSAGDFTFFFPRRWGNESAIDGGATRLRFALIMGAVAAAHAGVI